MARQVLSTIDLRTPDQKAGVTKKMQTIKSIMGIMQVLGEAEKVRRERQTLDRISRAITGGATTMEAIMAAANQQPQMGTGLPGMLQKIGGQLMPQGGGIKTGIQQGILQNAMTRALTPPLLTRPEEREMKLFGKRKRPEEEGGISDLKSTINKRSIKESFPKLVKGRKKVVRREGMFGDKVYGEDAYNEALKDVKAEASRLGIDEQEAVQMFDQWWDEQVGKERGQKFQKFGDREEFQEPKGTLDKAMAESILQEAGGDKEKAREIARQRGYEF